MPQLPIEQPDRNHVGPGDAGRWDEGGPRASRGGRRGGGKRLSRTDLLLITTQLSIMTRTGMDLGDAVRQLAKQSQNERVRGILEQIHADLEDGQSFSAALRAQAHVFGETFVASVAAGESSGRLTEVFARLKDLLRNEVRMQGALRGALMYPVILLFVAMSVLGALVFFVLPQFETVFQRMDAPTPVTTQLLLEFGGGLRRHWPAVLVGAVAFVLGGLWFRKTHAARRLRDRALLQTRWVRDGMQPLLTGRVLRMLATMLQSGVPLLESIRLCNRSVNNELFHELFDEMERDILNGTGIAATLAAAPFIPRGAAEMVATAEQSGQLGAVMELVGEFYEDEGERRIRDLVKLLEPLIIVVMGVVVAFVVASVMLPLFDLSSTRSF